MTISEELARFITATHYSDLPEEIIYQAKLCILDWIGATLAGAKEKSIQILLKVLRGNSENSDCTIIGIGEKSSCLNAAIINGSMSYAVKLDQSSPLGSMIHPQPPMIPAALSIAEMERLNGKEFTCAVVLGFEVEARVAMAINPSHMGERGFHTTGTCGTFGAAAAAGKLLNLKKEQMAHAFGIAGTQAAGLIASLGTDSRSLHAGKAAYNGTLAAMLANKGFTGSFEIFEGNGGFCRAMANSFDLSKIIEGLGEKYLINEQRFVRYVTCGAMHAAIDGVIELRKTHGFQPDDIELIDARVFPITLDLCGKIQEPQTFSEAQFSLPFALAIAAVDGEVSIRQLTEKRLKDPRVLNLAKKVRASVDPEFMSAGYTGSESFYQSAKVKIKIKNGKEFYKRIDLPKGSPQNPFSKEEILEKFYSLASLVLSKSKIENIIENLENIEKLNDIRKLINFMVP